MNYYDILNIPRNASDSEIKTAYRKLASKNHPDKGGSTEQFQKIEEAYRILSDPQKKQEYDNPQVHSHGFNGFNFNGQNIDLNEIFNMFHQNAKRNQHHVYRTSLFVTLEQVYYGGEHNLKIDTNNGSHFVKITIPKGIHNTMQIKYDQLIPNASLIVEFRIQKNLIFERINNDLYCNQQVSVLDLIVGTEFEMTTLDEKTISVKIPPRTNPNVQLKISGKGMPLFQGNNYGDLYINIKPFMPEHIDKSIIDCIQQCKSH